MLMAELVAQMNQNSRFLVIARNPLAQFGVPTRRYLGAEILPEVEKPLNQYIDERVAYRTIVANSAARYSPVQIKGGVITGAVEVRLTDSDSGSQFTGSDYDALISLIERVTNSSGSPLEMQAEAELLRWSDKTVNLPLVELNEVQRWQAIVNAQIVRTGDNGYREVINISNPTGQRVNAAGAWSNNSYDPYNDLVTAKVFLANKGYAINRIFASTSVITKLSQNANMRNRAGILSIAGGTIVGQPAILDLTSINTVLARDGFPAIERYDLQYRVQNAAGTPGASPFLPRDVFVLVSTTGRDVELDLGDVPPLILPDTLGYVGVGKATGQSSPGRVIKTRAIDDTKPPRVEGEGWQTSFPVILDPEAVYVIKAIT